MIYPPSKEPSDDIQFWYNTHNIEEISYYTDPNPTEAPEYAPNPQNRPLEDLTIPLPPPKPSLLTKFLNLLKGTPE